MTNEYDVILNGNEVDAIEAAKQLIVTDAADAAKLRQIAVNRQNKIAARVASIYALGFANNDLIAGAALLDILSDRTDDAECRAHAAEALAHIEEPKSIGLLEKILATEVEPTEIKRWCIYALAEIGSPKARNALRKFAKSKPIGVLADELQIALANR